MSSEPFASPRRVGRPAGADEVARLADELRYQRDLLSTITENAATALFMMDRDGFPVFMNAAACAMTGYAGIEEIRDRPLHYAVHFKRPDGSPYPMEECPIDRANAEIRWLRDQPEIWCRKDGTLFPVRYNVAPVERDGQRFGAVIEVRDVTEQLQREEERARLLREAESARERLHALFLQAPAAIAIVDGPDHVFSFANRQYEELVGRRASELLGRPVRHALPEAVEQNFLPLLDGVRATGKPYAATGAPYRPPGAARPRYVNFVYEPVSGSEGAVDSILALAVDVTGQVEAQQETQRLAAELEQRVAERTRELTTANAALRSANEALESFAYVVSHDLKEPIRAIENYLGAAVEVYGEVEGREFLDKAIEANRRQQALIQGLLGFSRASLTPIAMGVVDLDAAIRDEAASYYAELARERGASVRVETLPPVAGHEILLVQLFGNLVLNAIRHNRSAHPEVRVHGERQADGCVDVYVDDNGPGFPVDVRNRVEEAGATRPSTIKGGFGLAIAMRAAERLGGRLSLGRSPQGGARVHVALRGA